MKKIVFMVVGILVVIGLVGAGTFAYFSDTETSEGNVIQAGTIDLEISVGEPFASGFIDIKPCVDLGPFDFTLANVGNNEGILFTSMSYVEDDKTCEHEEEIDGCSICNFEFRSGATPPYPGMEMTAEQFARLVYVAAVEYLYTDEGYTGSWHDDLTGWLEMDGNSDGYLSLWEICQISQIPYDSLNEPFPATATITYRITFHLAHAFETAESGVAFIGLMSGYTPAWGYNLYMGDPVVWNVPQADGISLTVNGYLYQVEQVPA